MNNVTFFLLEHISNLLVMMFLIRLMLQLGQADFHNPISQFVHKFTAPVVNPLRKIIPDMGRFSTASFVVAVAIILVKFLIISTVFIQLPGEALALGVTVGLMMKAAPAMGGLVMIFTNMMLILFLGLMIASFMSGGRYHPGVAFLYQVTRPILRPIQKIIPPIAGTIDLSPLIVLFALWFIQDALYSLGVKLITG
ncbi:YggT family protein [Kangiella sediminilitoris]|uniref:Putative integral membrane protein n=1 Tax=Kangiella sediminilitoris TaxID=1144748 RepID=A0A1B3BDI9_9GAMM|nr:YggT family protein [Kangiella sediminilitoris]AOE50882.1 Putative integral membrane protein [Kangiella sediminilitoris]